MAGRSFEVGQEVRIVDGPWADFLAIIKEIDSEKRKLIVLVSIFGRETSAELEFHQLKAP